jgi:hypothetical protein
VVLIRCGIDWSLGKNASKNPWNRYQRYVERKKAETPRTLPERYRSSFDEVVGEIGRAVVAGHPLGDWFRVGGECRE